MYVFYAILIVGIAHNVALYLIGQRRCKCLHIAYFYILTILIVALRLVWFSMILYVTCNYVDNYSLRDPIFKVDVAATYLELLLGIQQVSQMFELYLMIKTSMMHVELATESEQSSFVTEKSGRPMFSVVADP